LQKGHRAEGEAWTETQRRAAQVEKQLKAITTDTQVTPPRANLEKVRQISERTSAT